MIDKKPLIYYCFAFLIGTYSALLLLNNSILGAVIVASFLLVIIRTSKSPLVYFLPIFLLMGFIRYYSYYKIEPPSICTLRYQGTEGIYSIGIYKGRKVILKGDLKNCKTGQYIEVTGKFISLAQFDRGIIGEMDIKAIIHRESDYVTKADEHYFVHISILLEFRIFSRHIAVFFVQDNSYFFSNLCIFSYVLFCKVGKNGGKFFRFTILLLCSRYTL